MMKSFLLIALLLLVGVFGKSAKQKHVDVMKAKFFAEIQTYLSETFENYGSDEQKDHCNDYPCCFLSNSTDGCSIANMQSGPNAPSTLVFPGGKTRCIFSYSSDFAIQVWPGEKDKLLLYFQGGGACWDAGSTYSDLCTSSIEPQREVGVFDRTNPENKWANYTIIHILYCSGDVHSGNVTRAYKDKKGGQVIQRGQANVVATYDWIKAQQEAGNLAMKFKDFQLMGQSAGSVGVQTWSGEFLSYFSYEKASVVPDSYIGVFPPNTEGPLIYDFGACNIGSVPALHVPPQYTTICNNQNMSLQYITQYWLSQHSDVDFAFLQSKGDAVQIAFYSAIALSTGHDPILTQGEFYKRSNAIMETYNKYPNFITYLVDGSQHTFTPLGAYYTAGPKGPRVGGDDATMHTWVPENPLDVGTTLDTVCAGKVKDNGVDSEDITLGPTYCDGLVYPKTYTQGNY